MRLSLIDRFVLDAHDFQRLIPARRPDDHRVAVTGLDEGFGKRRYPGDAAARQIGFVDADDTVGFFRAVAPDHGHCSAEEDLVGLLAFGGVHNRRNIHAFGQEADAAIDFAQAALAVDVVGIFRAVAIRRGPVDDLHQFGTLLVQQVQRLVLQPFESGGRDVVFQAGGQGRGRGVLILLVVLIAFLGKGLVHVGRKGVSLLAKGIVSLHHHSATFGTELIVAAKRPVPFTGRDLELNPTMRSDAAWRWLWEFHEDAHPLAGAWAQESRSIL